MAERCQHSDTDSRTHCDCPHFVPKGNLTATEVNAYDGCLHMVAWHRIPAQGSSVSTPTLPITSSIDQILATYSSQAASVSGVQKAQKRGKRKVSETEAHQEAVLGLKQSLGKSAAEGSNTVCSELIFISSSSSDIHLD
jgi:hypothetical protein